MGFDPNATATATAIAAKRDHARPETLVMLVGAGSGGFLGGRLLREMPPSVARRTVIAVRAAMTAIYA